MKRLAFVTITLLIMAIFTTLGAEAAKTVKIKLTGTCREKMVVKIGDTGRTETISDLPYQFELPKDALPLKLTFESPNYLYYSISVPKKPLDSTGHIYLVKIDETAMSLQSGQPKAIMAESDAKPRESVEGIDVTRGVNAAPITDAKNENTFAVIITNEDYELAKKVDNANNDGLAFREYCLKTLGLPANNVIHSSNLTYGKMRKVFKDIKGLSSLYDGNLNLLVYYAGHGIPDNETKDAFLMPVDADGTDTSVCFSLKDFYDNLNAMNLNQCVVFLDACFSGAQRDGDMIVAARGVKLKPKEVKPEGKTIVFSATSGDEAAYSYKEEEHGLFTYYLLKKLQESKGKASLGELADYLSDNVGKQSRLVNKAAQTPTVIVPPSMEKDWKSLRLRK